MKSLRPSPLTSIPAFIARIDCPTWVPSHTKVGRVAIMGAEPGSEPSSFSAQAPQSASQLPQSSSLMQTPSPQTTLEKM